MGQAQAKKKDNTKQHVSTNRMITEVNQYDSNNALYSNDNMTRIKHYLKFLCKNNFVSLTFVTKRLTIRKT